MTDGPDKPKRSGTSRSEERVESLATQAIALMASRRAADRSVISEKAMREILAWAHRNDVGQDPEFIDTFLGRGIRLEDIQDRYIPEAARRMGEAWERDEASFVDVSIGTARLHRLLLDLTPPGGVQERGEFHGLTVLCSTLDGETHILGARIVAAQLRRLGVSVRLCFGADEKSMSEIVAERPFDAIFISVGSAQQLAKADLLAEKLKKGTAGTPGIAVGGAVFEGEQGLEVLEYVDVLTNDPREALRRCVRTTLHHGASMRGS